MSKAVGSTEFHRANEIAREKVVEIMIYANDEGLTPGGIAHAAFRMGYLEAMRREMGS